MAYEAPIQYITREGDCPTVGTFAELLNLGSSGELPRPVIGKGMHRIRDLILASGDGVSVLTACGGSRVVKLKGATVHGDQVIPFLGWEMLNTGNCGFHLQTPAVYIPNVNIAVTPGEELEVLGLQTGTDSGTPTVGYTAVLDKQQAPKRRFISREGDITTLNTDTALTTIPGSTTTGHVQVPFDGTLTRIIANYANILPLATATGGSVFTELRSEGGFEGQAITLPIGGAGNLITTTGHTSGWHRPLILPFNRPVKQGGAIHVRGQQVGVDHGTPRPCVCLEITDSGRVS